MTQLNLKNKKSFNLKDRFRGFLPVVVDVETSGVDPCQNALIEMCVVTLELNENYNFVPKTTYFETILPFKDAVLDPVSLEFAKTPDPFYPLRFAVEEKIALKRLFKPIKEDLKKYQCNRAVLVGHNAWFDLLFIKEAVKRCSLQMPFHPFTCFDTATLAGFVYGQTVLSKAMQAAKIEFDINEAHSAIYDAEKTAELFCKIVNKEVN